MLKYSKLLAWMLVMMLAFGVVGCSDDDDDDNDPTGPTTTNYFDDVAQLGIDYFNTYAGVNISATDVYANLENEFIIDWRGATDYAAGHIDGAVNWAIADLDEHIADLPTDIDIINVCYTGQTASQVTAAMRLMGYDNAKNMLFGMCGWVSGGAWDGLTSGGFALETEANTMTETYDYPTALDVEAADVDEALLDAIDAYLTGGTKNITAADVYTDIADGEDIFVVNYWPEAEYLWGHVPGAYQLAPKSWSMDVLSKLPTDGTTKIVVYCYTGQTSSQVTSFLRILGYNAFSLKFGMNAIDQDHEYNRPYSAPTTDLPVVGG